MKSAIAFATLLASWSAVLAAPATKGDGFISQQSKANGHNTTDAKEVIILFDPKEQRVPSMKELMARFGFNESDVTHTFSNTVRPGFAAKLAGHCTEGLLAMAEVAHVEEKTDVKSFATQKEGAPWGLQRISNEAGAAGSAQGQNFTYTFDDESLGAGVDIYIVDTGVRVSHAVFTGRAQEGFSFNGTAADGDGHGTHTAGTAAGAKFGVAQGANVYAVKVLGDDGSGSSSDTIAGMDWVIQNHNKRKTQDGFVGSIMSMSWGLQGTAATVDEVIQGAVEAGIHVSVAAGNDGADACTTTPAHLGGSNSAVVTVGSVNIGNQVSTFSNIGSCVDLYAPGEQILSSWNTGDNIINFLSGTSMACPHNTGVMAYLMAEDAQNLGQNPAALKKKLLATARKNAFTGNIGGGQNLLLSNGADGGVAARLVKNYVVPDRDFSGEKRTITGSPASWANDLVNSNIDKRWELHSTDSPIRY